MGFDAEIVEISNLRGDLKFRTVYKPNTTASIADLKLHWDGKRVMFTSIMPDKRWNVFEVKLDGTGCKPLVETVEPDLEFYDGTYLPDGRIIANSNIGYQGVPCVSGADPVGNMVLYTPKDKGLRRLTFDQDANWNPVIMHNGRVMYTRWEYVSNNEVFRITLKIGTKDTKDFYGSCLIGDYYYSKNEVVLDNYSDSKNPATYDESSRKTIIIYASNGKIRSDYVNPNKLYVFLMINA
jgi:hypothetical protein